MERHPCDDGVQVGAGVAQGDQWVDLGGEPAAPGVPAVEEGRLAEGVSAGSAHDAIGFNGREPLVAALQLVQGSSCPAMHHPHDVVADFDDGSILRMDEGDNGQSAAADLRGVTVVPLKCRDRAFECLWVVVAHHGDEPAAHHPPRRRSAPSTVARRATRAAAAIGLIASTAVVVAPHHRPRQPSSG